MDTASDRQDHAATYGITKDFLEKVLQTSDNDVTINKFEVVPATEKGDNFASVALACKVHCTERNKNSRVCSLIIKTALRNEHNKTIMNNLCVFQKEASMFNIVFPTMRQVQVEQGIGPIMPSVPRHYFSVADDEGGYVVLADERLKKFKMANKLRGLDVDHCRLVLIELAKFHSISFFIKEHSQIEGLKSMFPEIIFRDTIYDRNNSSADKMREFLSVSISKSCQIVLDSQTDENVKRFAKFLKEVDLLPLLNNILKPEEPMAAICHGDCWVNNLLFKYDEQNTPVDIKLLDFQMVRYSSHATDLVYFICSSTTQKLRTKHLQDLLELYHSAMMSSLQEMRVPLPEYTVEDLKTQYKRALLLGLVSACFIIPLVLGNVEHLEDREANFKTEEEMGEHMETLDNLIAKISDNSKVRQRIVGLFEDFVAIKGLKAVETFTTAMIMQ